MGDRMGARPEVGDMTTLDQRTLRCFVCGGEAEYTIIGSTNSFGSPDLDTRPPEMMRSTLPFWVQRCPSCAYCAPDVRQGGTGAGPTVMSEEYIGLASDEGLPELATNFRCAAMVLEASGDLAGSGWRSIHAAWACDDDGEEGAAEVCRTDAIRRLKSARSMGVAFAAQAGGEEAILVDLLRRNGRFAEAETLCREGIGRKPENLISKVLRFERRLIERKDRRAHTVAEATGG